MYDGDTNPGGLVADFDITGFDIDQSLEEVQSVDVTAKVTYIDTAPAWTDPS